MSNRRCAAKTCFNLQGCRPNLKFFPFPKDETACRQWVTNCGRTDLFDKSIEQLSKLLLCADHFEPHWFLNPKYKTVFVRTGQPIPTIFHNNLADFVPKSLKKQFELKYAPKNETGGMEPSDVEINYDSGQRNPMILENALLPKHGCHKMCRLCACLVYEDKLISIFSEEAKRETLLLKINRLLPDKVEIDDGLPHHVCETCISKVNDCNHTVDTFIAADKKLRDLFQSPHPAAQSLTYIKLEEASYKTEFVCYF
ncbi:Uncharacterized protein GBIM_04445 [Gryllus bimaculatus]|nr:Uncharacterized protein GBIM_04445 [Gryllus bimaculatus]